MSYLESFRANFIRIRLSFAVKFAPQPERVYRYRAFPSTGASRRPLSRLEIHTRSVGGVRVTPRVVWHCSLVMKHPSNTGPSEERELRFLSVYALSTPSTVLLPNNAIAVLHCLKVPAYLFVESNGVHSFVHLGVLRFYFHRSLHRSGKMERSHCLGFSYTKIQKRSSVPELK